MKDLNELFEKGIEIVKDSCGAEVIGNIREVTINTRAKTRWGLCKRYNSGGRYSGYIIEISDRILQDKVPVDSTMSTIVHEILHACKGGAGHKGQWKAYAEKVMKKYPNLTITRTASSAFFGLDSYKNPDVVPMHMVQCVNCGLKHYSTKLSATIKYPYKYRCGRCGGELMRKY